jgi:hypothetical protein
MKKILVLALMVCLSGCLERIGQIDRNIKPYGAHWVKEGMTQESRRSDFIQCGGDVNLREGYAEWLSSVPYETYSAGKTQHIRAIAACMRFKNYVWQDSCDTRCL